MDAKFRYPAMGSLVEIDKAIEVAIVAAKTMKLKVQYGAIGVMILSGMEGKNDDGVAFQRLAIERANYLVEQLGHGIKGEGLVKFLVYMCGFKVNAADKKAGFINCSSREWVLANLEAAKEKAWYDYAPPNPFKGFNLAEELQRVIKQADNATKIAEGDTAKAEKVEIDRDMLEILHSLISGAPVHAKHALKLVERLIPDEEPSNNADEESQDTPAQAVG